MYASRSIEICRGFVMPNKRAAGGQANIFTRASHMGISAIITLFQLKHQFTADIIALLRNIPDYRDET